MKKSIIFILMALMAIQMASANLLGQHIVGTPDSGTLSNTFEVDGYVYGLRGSDHQFETQPLSSIQPTMYLTMWLEDNNKVLTISLWNYNTSVWDVLGTMPIGTKISAQFSVNTTNHYDPITNVMRVRMTEANGVWIIDKFIVSSAGLVETIKRVEQVDWVENVGSVTSLQKQSPTLNVLGTYYEIGDDAKVIAQVSVDGAAINDASCFASIYHPDNTVHIRNTRMFHIPNSEGLYIYDITIPETEDNGGIESVGVWPISVVCDFSTDTIPYYVQNVIHNYGIPDNGSGLDLWYDDEVYSLLQTEEFNETADIIDVELFYYNVTDPMNSMATRYFFEWQGYIESMTDDALIYWWNYDLSQWELSANVLNNQFTDASFESPQPLNESVDKYVSNNGTVRIKIAGISKINEETIIKYIEDFEDTNQQLPDVGTYGTIVINETIDDVNLYINTSGAISGTSSLRVTGSDTPVTTVTSYARDYLTTFGTLYSSKGTTPVLENGDIKAHMKYKLGEGPTNLDHERIGFLRFNVSDLSGTYITNAVLNLHYHTVAGTDVDGDSCYVDFMKTTDWSPLTAADWGLTGTVMFSVDTDDALVHVDDPYSVTPYVVEGEYLSIVMKARWKDTPQTNDECRLDVEEDIRVELVVTYADGRVEILFPVDTTDFYDMSVSFKEEVLSALSSDNFDYSVSSDGGNTWSSIYSFTGSHPYDEDSFILSSAYNDNPNVKLRVTAQVNSPATQFRLDDVTFTGTHRIPHDLYTDYVHLVVIDAATVINEVRGGGEFNVKNRLSDIEFTLEDINISISEVFTNDYEMEITNPDVMSPYDVAPLSVYLYKVSDKSFGVTGASCLLNVKGPATNIDSGAFVVSSYPLTEEGAGSYYGAPTAPEGGWPKGIYKISVNCDYSGNPIYGTTNIRVEDSIYARIWEYATRALTTEGNEAIADEVWMVNRTIDPGLKDQVSGSVWNYISRYVHGEILN